MIRLPEPAVEPPLPSPAPLPLVSAGTELLDLVVRQAGVEVAGFSAAGDPDDSTELRDLLLDAVLRRGDTEDQLTTYELRIVSDKIEGSIASDRALESGHHALGGQRGGWGHCLARTLTATASRPVPSASVR